MKIKYVKNPIESHPECRGCYEAKTNTILIRKGVSAKEARVIIRHEIVHGIISKLFGVSIMAHYCNMVYDITWVILFEHHYTIKKNTVWYYKYYTDARKNDTLIC